MEFTVSNVDLPAWVVTLFFLIGGFATLLEIVRIVGRAINRPVLESRLTKDFFFRLIDSGECVFCNAILLARNGAVEITNVGFELRRKNEAGRSFSRIVPLFLGEKRHTDNAFAENTFYSASPLMFIPPNQTIRPIYLSAFEEHRFAISKTIDDYRSAVKVYRDSLRGQIEQVEKQPDEFLAKIGFELKDLARKAVADVLDKVEIKPGEYELVMKVKYRPEGAFFRSRLKESQSKIGFEVADTVRNDFRSDLEQLLLTVGWNTIYNKNDSTWWPQYRPSKVLELD